ncbi:MAG TPA: hypothetical protein VG223_17475 [Solirubrobacteraceae bacterium]|nr:hypothetical protein [Solirubrobacteraceae bacterium]
MTGRRAVLQLGWRGALTGAVLLLALVAVALAQTGVGQGVTGTLGLSAPAEPYTELYFADPTAVAAITEAPRHGTAVQRPAFTIRDEEGHSLTYRWSISVDGVRQRSGTQALATGQKDTIAAPVRVRCRRAGSADVAVALQHPSESISYLVSCRG